MARPARRALALVLGLLLVASGCQRGGPTPGAELPVRGGRILFDDDFSGGSLSSRWGTCHWWSPDGCTIATNDELEWYQRSQVSVADGALRLRAEPGTTVADGEFLTYLSGMVSSGRPGDEPTDRARFSFTYGRVDVRFRVPRGAGTWPAIWMLPVTNESLPEIDLLEVHGDDVDLASTTLHTADGDRRRTDVDTADLSVGWHTVGLVWKPGLLVWSIDGDEAFRVVGPDVPSERMYLVANLAVGGDAGPPDPDAFPATFLVDRVTVRSVP